MRNVISVSLISSELLRRTTKTRIQFKNNELLENINPIIEVSFKSLFSANVYIRSSADKSSEIGQIEKNMRT